MVVTGEGKLAGGLLVSAGNALLFTASIWGRVGKRFGARSTMSARLPGDGATLLLAGVLRRALSARGPARSCCAAPSSPSRSTRSARRAFMRAVRSYERPQMAAVYRTYLDLSELLPPLVYSIVLAFFGLGAVFATLGVFCAVCGVLTWRYLPKSM